MNIDQSSIPSDLREAFRDVEPRSLHIFCQSLREQETARLGSLSEKDLTELQARVKLISELEHLFLQIQKTKTN